MAAIEAKIAETQKRHDEERRALRQRFMEELEALHLEHHRRISDAEEEAVQSIIQKII